MQTGLPDTHWDADEIRELICALEELRSGMLKLEASLASRTDGLDNEHKDSARNLIHYLALRGHDIRRTQEKLAAVGLSSLGRAEPEVMTGVERVLAVLRHLEAPPSGAPGPGLKKLVMQDHSLLERRTTALLGPTPAGRRVRIMVTVPTEAAYDYELVRDLVQHGMDCMRVNCAHDDPTVWGLMISNLQRARRELGKACCLEMDLPGPKLRTGPVEPGPRVIKIRPHRDDFGRVTAPARLWLTAAKTGEIPPSAADAVLSLPANWLSSLRTGSSVEFNDARGASRSMKIVGAQGESRWAESEQTSYIVPGIELHADTHGGNSSSEGSGESDVAAVAAVPPKEQALVLKPGDTLILTRSLTPGRPASRNDRGQLLSPATIGVTLPGIFGDVRSGEAVWFDDGRIGGVVRSADPQQIRVEITHARVSGQKLGADKGVNLPDSNLHLAALTEQDLEALPFIVKHADLVGYSFVRDEAGVHELQRRLAELGGSGLGIILKIETRKAFENLPQLLLASMRSARVGVMIARGDLAVECGYERLAEVQEEILWFCEAAHIPVIWATQVLESLAKLGMPSRAEITDAAMAERAECVMLNKGPYVVDAVRALDDILRRMEAHQAKKRPTLRRLGLAAAYANR
jgi:pyruvate kinase